jgi:hypothetical protein
VVRSIIAVAIRLILLSLVVGLILSFLHLSPLGLFADFGATLRTMAAIVPDLVHWAIPYVLLGAEIVIPIALLLGLLRMRRR